MSTDSLAPASSPFKLRLATKGDLAELYAFYDENKHLNVCVRRPENYAEATKNGDVTLLIAPDGKICGSSIAWRHLGNLYTELGSTRIASPKIGYPFYELMIASQTLHAFFHGAPEDRIVAEVDRTNMRVINRLTGETLLFRPWAAPSPFLTAKKTDILENDSDDTDYFQLGVEALPTHARHVLAIAAAGGLAGRNGAHLPLDISALPIFTRHHADLVRLAASDWGNPDQPDATKSMRAWRENLADLLANAPAAAGPAANPAPRPTPPTAAHKPPAL